ncbi:Clr5 domain-containing protein [Fusarium keratoplasticum]|uniref:Clr5 domain-containing protein n=1 Tax=Fusarium keratoplasticum TaxID=1328300 RepID=A0ACC0QI02_9HYPO|nr:Clr5 domain-containing protein [Fusarium keratoplasticum]KAI8655146.1 Clr5 domain-containing protein [Fusarium keratoplasticum]
MIPEMPSPSSIWLQEINKYRDATKYMLFSHVDSSGFLMGVFANKEPYFPHTPLQLASSSHDPDFSIVESLLNQGADVNTPAAEWNGRTALQGAISAKKLDIDIVKLLLDRGANVNAPPAQVGGVTALQAAAIRGDIQLVRLLLARGAKINAPGAPDEGRTALEGAAEHGRMEMLRFLLSKGAMPDFVTGYSRAIELAEKELHLGIAKFLREEQRKLHEVGWGLGSLGFDLQSL